jgi:transcription termination/antitermination protein NusG
VAHHLAARDVGHYLPLMERVHLTNGRRLVSAVPVFPGYVFLKGELEDAYEAVSTRRVCQIIPIRDQSRFVRELAQIRRALAGRAPLEIYPFAVSGKKCRVARGPLQGLEGVVLERLNCIRLVLQVDILGRGVALEIDIAMLEPVD